MMGQLEAATGLNIIGAAPHGKAAYEGSRLGHGVLTYALLEAMNKAEGGAADPVDVYALAGHVGRRVPALSESEFSIRQKPETKLRDNFPLGVRAAVLKEAEPEAKPAAVIRPVELRAAAAADAPVKESAAARYASQDQAHRRQLVAHRAQRDRRSAMSQPMR